MFATALFVLHFVLTCVMAGNMWFVQICYYPNLAAVGREAFVGYQKEHIRRITVVAWTMLFLELITAIALVCVPHHRGVWVGLIVNLALLLFTFAQSRLTAAESVAHVLRAQALELVDDRGRVRSRLNVEPGGEVVLRLLDENGTIRVKLGADEDGSGLLLANDATEPGVHILANGAGTTLKLADKSGRQTVIAP